MKRRHQRDALRVIEREGGVILDVRPGARHWLVTYAIGGQTRRTLIRFGSRAPTHALPALVGELRKAARVTALRSTLGIPPDRGGAS